MRRLRRSRVGRGHVQEIESVDPEIQLQALCRALDRLRRLAGPKQAGVLTELLNQAVAVQLVYGRNLIGVAGGQGVGKTTLLSQAYGGRLDAWLAANNGRGEQCAIAIVEEPGRTDVGARLHVLAPWDHDSGLRDGLSVETVTDLTVWHNAVRGLRADVVLAELVVPGTELQGAGERGFLLLPGHEPHDRTNRDWQQRMRRQLVACNGFVIVIDHSRLAQAGERTVLQDLHAHLVAGARPVVAVTKTENLDQATRVELLEEARRQFADTSGSEPQHVLATGTGTLSEEWVPLFWNAVQDVGVRSQDQRALQLDSLADVVGDRLTDVVDDEGSRMLLAARKSAAPGAYTDALERFDEQADKLAVQARARLEDLLAPHASAVRAMAGRAAEAEGGWGARGKALLVTLRLRRDRPEERIRAAVQQAWQETVRDVGPAVQDCLLMLVTSRVNEICSTTSSTELVAGSELATTQAARNSTPQLPPSVGKVLQIVGGQTHDELPDTTAVAQAYEVLPALAVAYMAIGLAVPPDRLGGDTPPSTTELTSALKQFGAEHKLLVRSMVGLLGVDLLDGDLNVVGGLASGLSALLGNSVAASSLMMPAAAILAVGAGLVYVNGAARAQEEREQFARRLVQSYEEQILETWRVSLREVLDNARDTLDRRLREYYRMDEGLALQQRSLKAIVDVGREQRRMREAIQRAGLAPF